MRTLCQCSSQSVPGVVFVEILVRSDGVDDEDLVCVRIRLLAEVDVVEVGRVLVTEEQAGVAVAVVGVRAQDFHVELEIAQHDVLQQRNVVRAAVRRVVIAAFLELAVNVLAVGLFHLPRLGVGRFPAVGAVLKVLADHQRKVLGQTRLIGGRGERQCKRCNHRCSDHGSRSSRCVENV